MSKYISQRRSDKIYREECRAFKKALKQCVKQSNLFDAGGLHDTVNVWVSHMLTYYKAGAHVYSTEFTRNAIIYELEEVNGLFKELDHLYDEFRAKPKPKCVTKSGIKAVGLNKELIELLAKLDNREHELYKDIYAKIGQCIQEWWD